MQPMEQKQNLKVEDHFTGKSHAMLVKIAGNFF